MARWSRTEIARWYSIRFGVEQHKGEAMAGEHINRYGYVDPTELEDKLVKKVKKAVS